MIGVLVVLAAALSPMLGEARLSARHERALRAMGAVEPPSDPYAIMRVAYPASFVAPALEALWRGGVAPPPWFVLGAALFTLGKVVKYWAIASLGPRWTFRVLAPPSGTLVRSGPYRWLRHPNYLGVCGEIAGLALMLAAPVTGILAFVGFGLLMLRRIRVEDAALASTRH